MSSQPSSSGKTFVEPYLPQPLATWSTARDVWETPDTEGLFCEHSDVYSETFPTSGMTRNGTAYALPTWEPATDDSESSYLPTPTVRDYKDNRIRREPHRPNDTDTLSRALADLI